MRPYQITATERIINRIKIAHNYKKYGSIEAGGYIWHSTGSGKTLTSFKTAQLARDLPYIDKVLFVVDRKDLDYQTMKEYDRFEKNAANSNTSTTILARQLGDDNCKIIITTIQKLSTFIKKNKGHDVYSKQIVLIFDECHRSQFGDMHDAIVKSFKQYYMFGFTGTPIFSDNAGTPKNIKYTTTEQTFGKQLHSYTLVNAIEDKNVLPFRVEYQSTMKENGKMVDEDVFDIDREKALENDKRIQEITRYILDNFDRKTYRGNKTYELNALTNVSDVAASRKAEEIKQKQRRSGFNSLFAVASVHMAIKYYKEFCIQMEADPTKKLKIAMIYSFAPNKAEEDNTDGIIDEENPENTSNLDEDSRNALDAAIADYNAMFHTNYDTSGEKFQNYYKDVSLRMKNKELDLLIVVNMFLTGFDAPTLNTLWVDKNLKMHGLIQAFSRTNRILNSVKAYGNIVCFRNLEEHVKDALSVFNDKDINAPNIVLICSFDDYFNGYTDKGEYQKGYVDLINELEEKYPLSAFEITGKKDQKEFLKLFGNIMKMRNLLSSFDEFAQKDMLSERDFQDYSGRYQDEYDKRKKQREKGEIVDVNDDIVFEMELIKQVEVNVDYILMLVEKYHGTHCNDKEMRITIQKAIESSPQLRSKRALIETFLANINGVSDVLEAWHNYIAQQKENDLRAIIDAERLNEKETRKLLNNALEDGEIKTIGTDIDKVMPPMSRFGKNKNGENRDKKKQQIICLLQDILERYYEIVEKGGFSENEIEQDLEQD